MSGVDPAVIKSGGSQFRIKKGASNDMSPFECIDRVKRGDSNTGPPIAPLLKVQFCFGGHRKT